VALRACLGQMFRPGVPETFPNEQPHPVRQGNHLGLRSDLSATVSETADRHTGCAAIVPGQVRLAGSARRPKALPELPGPCFSALCLVRNPLMHAGTWNPLHMRLPSWGCQGRHCWLPCGRHHVTTSGQQRPTQSLSVGVLS
jgi:hypothetical protein